MQQVERGRARVLLARQTHPRQVEWVEHRATWFTRLSGIQRIVLDLQGELQVKVKEAACADACEKGGWGEWLWADWIRRVRLKLHWVPCSTRASMKRIQE